MRDYKDLIDKVFVLGFVWMTPLSLVGIIRSGLLWMLINGVEIEIPHIYELPPRDEESGVASNEESVVGSNEDGESVIAVDDDEDSVTSQSEEEQAIQQESITSFWKLKKEE